jgi:hypothetical protein
MAGRDTCFSIPSIPFILANISFFFSQDAGDKGDFEKQAFPSCVSPSSWLKAFWSLE